MKFKRLMSASLAGIMAVSSGIVCQIGASAAGTTSLEKVPEGKETVIASADLSSVTTKFTTDWENGDWTKIEGLKADVLKKDNVYVKIVVNDLGKVVSRDEQQNIVSETPWSDVLTWGFENYNWAVVLKWYNNTDDGPFEVSFAPATGSTVEEAVFYAPVSAFALTQWGQIAGNIQAGHTAGFTIKSIDLVEVSAASEYKIKVEQPKVGGEIKSVTPEAAKEGDDVKVVTSPAHGYDLFSIDITDGTKPIEGVKATLDGNTGTFKMPGQDITVSATFSENDKVFVEDAAKAATEALKTLKATTATTPDDVLKAVSDAVDKAVGSGKITIAWKANPTITPATEEKAGSIVGTLVLTKNKEKTEVEVNVVIPQLPVDDESRVAMAKELTEELLSTYKATNDTKQEDLQSAIDKAIVDTKAKAEIKDFKLTPATTKEEGSISGSVVLTSGKETATVTIALKIEKLEPAQPEPVEEPMPAATEVIWEGSQALGNWEAWVEITKDISGLGDGTLVIETEKYVEGGQLAVKIAKDKWPVLDGTKEYYDLEAGSNKLEIPVTAKAMAATKGYSTIIAGKLVTVKKVTFVSANPDENYDKKVTVEAKSDDEPSVSTVITDVKSDGTKEQIAVCAISEEAAKTYKSYTVTITRTDSDGKKYEFKETVTDCWKKATYTNIEGKEVLVEAAEGDYCILLDITGISKDWGTLIVKITANKE